MALPQKYRYEVVLDQIGIRSWGRFLQEVLSLDQSVSLEMEQATNGPHTLCRIGVNYTFVGVGDVLQRRNMAYELYEHGDLIYPEPVEETA